MDGFHLYILTIRSNPFIRALKNLWLLFHCHQQIGIWDTDLSLGLLKVATDDLGWSLPIT